MRVLILSAFLAVAAAAPSGHLTHTVLLPAVRAVAVPAAIPTISPGDIQAAAIDAQVKANDAAQAAVDKARELAELASIEANEKAITISSGANEQNLDAFYSTEDKKWQAVDALKTAEAQIDGAVASSSPILAKSVVSGAIPYLAAVGPLTPIAAPISPVFYGPLAQSQSYSASSQTVYHGQGAELKTEIKEESKEAAVKTAEPEKPAEGVKIEAAEKTETAAIPESPALKAAENLNEKPALIGQSLVAPIGLSNVYSYNLGVPAVGGQLIAQPLLKYDTTIQQIHEPVLKYATSIQQIHEPALKYGTTVQQVHGVLTPTYVKTVW